MIRKKLGLLLIIIVLILATCAIISINKKDDSNLKKVTVAEVAHSIFYAPQYVASSLGYFEEEGIDMDGAAGEEILEASEVFDIGDGRYLIVEG